VDLRWLGSNDVDDACIRGQIKRGVDAKQSRPRVMSTIITALTKFGQSLAAIGISLLYSVLAVFQAVFALAQSTIENILKLGQSISTLVLELFQGVFGFVIANFAVIIVIGGGYYLYMLRQQGRGPKILEKKRR